jgi:membrane-bound serine protease (ClpP class)
VAKGDGNGLIQFLVLMFMEGIIVGTGVVFMMKVVLKSKRFRSKFVEEGTAVSTGHAEGTLDHTGLVGALGVAITDLRPIGKANINGNVYDVQTENFYLNKGVGIEVISAEGVKIIVKKAE